MAKTLICKCGKPRDLANPAALCLECRREKVRECNRRKRARLTPEEKIAYLAKDRQRDLINRLRDLGLSLDQYNARLVEQGYSCGICLSTEPRGQGRWHIDHDHATGKFRGILCGSCNRALGLFKDSPGNLIRAVNYLSKSLQS